MENLQVKPQICKLLWEKETFGIKAGKINLPTELDRQLWDALVVEMKDYEMIVIANEGNNSKNNLFIGELENCFLADVNVQFEKKLNNNNLGNGNVDIEVKNNKEFNEDLIKIAEKSFVYSRFNNDPRLDKEKAKNIYVDWTINSFNKENKYFVTYKEGNRSIGFILFSIEEVVATIELVAVDKEYQNRRIGNEMLKKLDWYLNKLKTTVNSIRVGTQAENNSAIIFYQKNKFKIKKVNSIYHCWK